VSEYIKVLPSGERVVENLSPCVFWAKAGSKGKRYGGRWFRGKWGRAHRAAWSEAHGEIPPGGLILHKCNNKLCVNPTHLYLGTKSDNARDALMALAHGVQKISYDQAIEIRSLRASGCSLKEIAKRFSISRSTVSRIAVGKAWSWQQRKIAEEHSAALWEACA
jgi:hypothetical protein